MLRPNLLGLNPHQQLRLEAAAMSRVTVPWFRRLAEELET